MTEPRGASIRPHVYRGQVGFLVTETGEPRHVFRVQVFTFTRTSAEKIRLRIRDDQDVTMEDFA